MVAVFSLYHFRLAEGGGAAYISLLPIMVAVFSLYQPSLSTSRRSMEFEFAYDNTYFCPCAVNAVKRVKHLCCSDIMDTDNSMGGAVATLYGLGVKWVCLK